MASTTPTPTPQPTGGQTDPLLSGPPPPSPLTTTEQAIGVPVGYTAPDPFYDMRTAVLGQPPASSGIPPRYHHGDEYVPAGLSVEAIADLQTALATAGLLTGTVAFGVWDEPTAVAYREVLAQANRGGISDTEALAQLLSAPKVDVSAAEEALPYRPADPATLRAVVKEAAESRLGREMTSQDRQALIAALQEEDRAIFEASAAAEQETAAAVEGAAGGESGSVEGAAQVDAESRVAETIDAFFQERFGGEIAARQRREETVAQQSNAAGLFNTVSQAI